MENFNKKQRAYLTSLGILPKWHDKTFEDFDNDPASKIKVKNYIKNIRNAKKKGVGLYLWGRNGTGKTHIMNTLFIDLMHNKKQRVRVVTLTTLINWFAEGWRDRDKRNELYSMLQNVDFLGIEEVGKEFRSLKSEQENLANVALDTILKIRLQFNKVTWFTSNKQPNDLESIYTEDIASMLREMVIPIKIQGEDRRKEISKTNRELLR